MAVRALWAANREVDGRPLAGILWWKLSSQRYHFDDEPFVLIIHETSYDPLIDELRRFRRWDPVWEARRRLGM